MAEEIIIHAGNWQQFVQDPIVGGDQKSRGLIPRDYTKHPPGCYATGKTLAVEMPLIPRSEWDARIQDKIAQKSQISDIRMVGNGGQPIPSLDQNGKGYCWAHSSTSAMMMARAVANQPYVALSAYAIACIIKNFRDEGGWGAESMDFITSRGVPSDKFWPMQSMDKANDNANTWNNAAQHKLLAGWIDLASAQYDRNLTFDQVGTLLLSDVPVVCDYNWWSHSVCGIDLVSGTGKRPTTRDPVSGKVVSLQEFDRIWGMDDPVTAGYGVRILNSWGDSWSDHGMGVLTSNKAVPDGSVAPRVITASPV